MVCRGYVYAKAIGQGVSQPKTELGWLSCYPEPEKEGVDDLVFYAKLGAGVVINVLLYFREEAQLIGRKIAESQFEHRRHQVFFGQFYPAGTKQVNAQVKLRQKLRLSPHFKGEGSFVPVLRDAGIQHQELGPDGQFFQKLAAVRQADTLLVVLLKPKVVKAKPESA